MPRQGRINIEGAVYHVIQRGIERGEIFRDEADREEFVRRLADGLRETEHRCYGWALMPNHFHLLMRTSARPLSDLMRKLLTGYALYFNRKYKRSGYVYQNRYKSILCQEESYLLELVRYIHLNPYRARLVKDMRELARYKWSGHAALTKHRQAEWQATGEILELFGKKTGPAMTAYESFVEEAKDQGRRRELSGGGLVRSAGGWQEVLELRRSKERWQGDERILGDGEFVQKVLRETEEQLARQLRLKKEGWDIARLVRKVCAAMNVDEKEIRREARRSNAAEAKSLIIYLGNRELGISGVELAQYFGITKASISAAVRRGSTIAAKNEYLII